MRHSFMHTLGNIVWAVRSHRRAVRPLLVAYTALKLRELAALRAPSDDGVQRARVLGWDVRFFDHYWLVEMFEEIFLREQYYFESDSDSPLVLDVGSNIGLSILYFKRLYPRARIVGFEPDPETFRVLEENVRANRLQDVTLVQEAVSDGAKSLVLYRNPATPGSPQQGASGLRSGGHATTVRAGRLSDRLTEPIDYLKLDVEGAEGSVLADLDRTRKLPLARTLTVECHHLSDGDGSLSDVLSILERNGFGYQLEARPGAGRPEGAYQNVLVHAYRKGIGGDVARRTTSAE